MYLVITLLFTQSYKPSIIDSIARASAHKNLKHQTNDAHNKQKHTNNVIYDGRKSWYKFRALETLHSYVCVKHEADI